MATPNYPSSVDLIITFLNNVRRYSVNSISGMNPTLINVNGEQMFVYIKNLSPAQLSNDNPDVWRIQLPKRQEFDDIKQSDKMFVLFGYDYVRKVYTTWNPYWCKQRLNVAESCSMYSRLSLQNRVASNQKIEKMQLLKDGDVVCIPSALLASYLKNIRSYYPEESTYVPVGSSIQKRIKEESEQDSCESQTDAKLLFEKFLACYDKNNFVRYLLEDGKGRDYIKDTFKYVDIVLDCIYKYAEFFYEYTNLKDYKHAINRLIWHSHLRCYSEQTRLGIKKAMNKYIAFVENVMCEEGLPNNKGPVIKKDARSKQMSPQYKLDQFGKLKKLDTVIIDYLTPQVRGVDYPDYESIIIQIKKYYPEEATKKMTPADWLNLFDSTRWQKRRGRKSSNNEDVKAIIEEAINDRALNKTREELGKVEERNNKTDVPNTNNTLFTPDKRILDKVFEKKITSYKYFWFVAIITLVKNRGKLVVPYDDILIRMAALAWPIILQDGIDLGERDMLKGYLKEIQKKTYLISAASGRVVESSLTDYYETLGIKGILSPLLNNVPYRFLSPWVKFTNNEEVVKISQRDDFQGPYALFEECVVIRNEWGDYILSHYAELRTFAYKSFLNYAKLYNNDLKLLKLMRSGWDMI